MKSRFSTYVAAIAFFAVLAIPVQLAAQDKQDHRNNSQHHHYQLIDMGTFGGPLSGINEPLNYVPLISGQGQTLGFSSIPVLASSTNNPTACFGTNVSHAFEWQNGAVTDLGSLAGAAFCSDADSINAHGTIEGVSENGAVDPLLGLNEIRAVVWNNGALTDLGTLGGNHSWSFGINNRDQVVGMSLNGIPDPYSIYDFVIFGSSSGTQTRAFLWRDGAMQDLSTLGGPDAWAWSINDHGQILGWSYTNSTPNSSTGFPTLDPFFIDNNGKIRDIGTLGGVVGFPGALNSHGQAIGGSSTATNPGACYLASHQSVEFGDPNCHPFLWDQGKLTDLNTSTAGGNPQTSDGINDAGEIVGAATFPTQPYDAYLWTNGAAQDLGHLGGDCYSEAWALNLHGQVVGNSFGCGSIFQHDAFLWENGSIVNLNHLIPPGSSLQLVFANAINDRGEIAGNGVPPGASPADVFTSGHAFLLIPCDENHPGVEGCDYSLTDPFAQSSSAEPALTRPVLPPALWKRNNSFRFPLGPRNQSGFKTTEGDAP